MCVFCGRVVVFVVEMVIVVYGVVEDDSRVRSRDVGGVARRFVLSWCGGVVL